MSRAGTDLSYVRFQQRFTNLEAAMDFLKEAMAETGASPRVKSAAIIKAYELAFELSWKVMKDYLSHKGVSATTPRDVIKEAFRAEIIGDGQIWISLLDRRNHLVHVYSKAQADASVAEIQAVAVAPMTALIQFFQAQSKEQL